jgi:uncharacterized protein
MQTQTMTEQELDQLESMLDSEIFKGEAMTLDMLQGYLCAVISGPDAIPPSVWLPEALGEAPEYPSSVQAEEAMGLVMKFYNTLAATLANQEEFDLILYSLEENPDELDYAPWCDGYVFGSQIGETNWFEAAGEYAEDLGDKMEVFFLLSGLLKEDALESKEPWLSEKEEKRRMALAREAFPSTIGALYQFWLAQRAIPSPVRRESPKVGRNDPCPCGSGKKFKQCCGKAPTVH